MVYYEDRYSVSQVESGVGKKRKKNFILNIISNLSRGGFTMIYNTPGPVRAKWKGDEKTEFNLTMKDGFRGEISTVRKGKKRRKKEKKRKNI